LIARRFRQRSSFGSLRTVWLDTKTVVRAERPRFFIEEAVAALRCVCVVVVPLFPSVLRA
jgi:hypothetical protein